MREIATLGSTMKSGQAQRLFRGILAKGFGQGSIVAIRLAQVPLFLHFWGVELYGEWLVLVALPTYLTMSDFGFAHVTNRQLAMLVARDEYDEALSSFQSSSLLILGLSVLVAALFIALMWTIPVTELFNLGQFTSSDLMAVIALLSLQVIFSSQTKILFGGYYSMQRYPLGFMINSFIQIGQFAVVAAVVAFGAGPIEVALAMTGAQMAGAIGMRAGLYRIAPWLRYGFAHLSRTAINVLTRPAIAGMAFPLGQAMSQQGTRLVLAALFGPSSVVIFVTHRQLARLVNLVTSLEHPFRAELSNIFGSNDLENFRALARKTFQILMWAILPAIALNLILAELIFEIWTDGQVVLDRPLFFLLLAASVFECIWLAALTPVIAVNRHIGVAGFYAAISLALLPTIYLVCRFIGLAGAAEVLILAEVCMIWIVIRNALTLTNDRFVPWLNSVSRIPLPKSK